MSQRIPRIARASFTLAGAAAVILSYSEPRIATAQSGPPSIPQEAYASCESKSDGDACSVRFRDMEIKGTCTKEPSGSKLFCRPNEMPPPPR